ncbi:sce7726 family protein [Rhodopila sp.]|uniref:sce7726 family protein n=1 Tax=Rhodopila sp. TaxID=2480087 RepID=UPI003D14F385
MGDKIRDAEVRRAAHGKLLRNAHICPDTLVIDELGLGHGVCRVDIAVINGHIRGLEIKAEADILDRLPHQVKAYGEVVDRATLIVAPRHLSTALEIVPKWWGVIAVDRVLSGGIVFRKIREERANRHVNPMMLARLLWHPEAATILREHGQPEHSLRQPREALYRELVALLSRRDLAHGVRDALRNRATWRDRPEPL